ncbi:MAG: copper resistance protein CopC [Alphaproteobacteria bacterium]
MRNTVRRLVIASALSLLGGPAAAHAFLSQAVPPVGGVVSSAPREVRLTFTEGIEPAFSRIELAGADGRPIGTAPATVDPRDNTQLVLALPPLAPGRYRVKWRVVSIDTHVTEGDYTFEISP